MKTISFSAVLFLCIWLVVADRPNGDLKAANSNDLKETVVAKSRSDVSNEFEEGDDSNAMNVETSDSDDDYDDSNISKKVKEQSKVLEKSLSFWEGKDKELGKFFDAFSREEYLSRLLQHGDKATAVVQYTLKRLGLRLARYETLKLFASYIRIYDPKLFDDMWNYAVCASPRCVPEVCGIIFTDEGYGGKERELPPVGTEFILKGEWYKNVSSVKVTPGCQVKLINTLPMFKVSTKVIRDEATLNWGYGWNNSATSVKCTCPDSERN